MRSGYLFRDTSEGRKERYAKQGLLPGLGGKKYENIAVYVVSLIVLDDS